MLFQFTCVPGNVELGHHSMHNLLSDLKKWEFYILEQRVLKVFEAGGHFQSSG